MIETSAMRKNPLASQPVAADIKIKQSIMFFISASVVEEPEHLSEAGTEMGLSGRSRRRRGVEWA
jgi:hypothetical protein